MNFLRILLWLVAIGWSLSFLFAISTYFMSEMISREAGYFIAQMFTISVIGLAVFERLNK